MGEGQRVRGLAASQGPRPRQPRCLGEVEGAPLWEPPLWRASAPEEPTPTLTPWKPLRPHTQIEPLMLLSSHGRVLVKLLDLVTSSPRRSIATTGRAHHHTAVAAARGDSAVAAAQLPGNCLSMGSKSSRRSCCSASESSRRRTARLMAARL